MIQRLDTLREGEHAEGTLCNGKHAGTRLKLNAQRQGQSYPYCAGTSDCAGMIITQFKSSERGRISLDDALSCNASLKFDTRHVRLGGIAPRSRQLKR